MLNFTHAKRKVICPNLTTNLWLALFGCYTVIVSAELYYASMSAFAPLSTPMLQLLSCVLGVVALYWIWKPSTPLTLALYGLWAFVFFQLPLYKSSETDVFGWLLIALAFKTHNAKSHYAPIEEWLWEIMWLMLMLIYVNSGVSKALDIGWQDGTTLQNILNSQISELPVNFSPTFCIVASWLLILLQAFTLLTLLPSTKLKAVFWYAHCLFHVFTFFVLKVGQVSLVFLIFHLILFRNEFIWRRKNSF